MAAGVEIPVASGKAKGLHVLALCLVVLGVQFTGTTVQAGPVEQLVELAFGPGDSPVMIARYMNGGGGLFISSDRGRSWGLQCAGAFLEANATLYGPVSLLHNGTLLLPTSRGLWRSDTRGCQWQREDPMPAGTVGELALDPTDGNAVFALINSGNGGRTTTVLARRNAEGVWAAIGKPDGRYASSLRVADNAGRLRFYEIAQHYNDAEDGGAASVSFELRSSDDSGQSWRAFPIAADGNVRIVGVDPGHADQLVILVSRSGAADSILISHDGGATRTPYLELGEFGGLAFAPNGRLWIGDLGDSAVTTTPPGLWAAENLDTAPRHLPGADYPVECVGYRAASDTLYACQRFWLGEVDPASGTFSTVMKMTTVSGFVACEGVDVAASCERQLCAAYCGASHFAVAPVCSAYDTPSCGVSVARDEASTSRPTGGLDAGKPSMSGADAGVVHMRDAAADGGGGVMTARGGAGEGCSCRVQRRSAAHGAGSWLLLWAAVLLGWRRRGARCQRALSERERGL